MNKHTRARLQGLRTRHARSPAAELPQVPLTVLCHLHAAANRNRTYVAQRAGATARKPAPQQPTWVSPAPGPSAPASSSATHFDASYVDDDSECCVTIRLNANAQLSLMFLSRPVTPVCGIATANVTRVALRADLSGNPQNLANQVLRQLFAQGDPARHASDAQTRSRLRGELMSWAARYLTMRAKQLQRAADLIVGLPAHAPVRSLRHVPHMHPRLAMHWRRDKA